MIRSTRSFATRFCVRLASCVPSLLFVAVLVGAGARAAAQSTSPVAGPASAALVHTQEADDAVGAQIREVRLALEAMREQLVDSRRESEALRRELQAMREQLDSLPQVPGRPAGPTAAEPDTRERLDALAQEQELLGAKVEDQEQTKVESGSKYHVRLSGLALMNVVSTRGSVDNLDLPVIALRRGPEDSGGSFGAGVRQSLLSLEVFGPTLGDVKTTGDLTFDFFGGFPVTNDGVSSPFVRLRTAKIMLEWKHTSVVAGQETPFFSPRSPTSLASTAYPALSSSGNMWAWTPQVQVEHQIGFSRDSTMTIQWGVLDPFTGELPAHEYSRTATAGERSGVPAEAVRVGWQHSANERVAALAAGAYYSKQDWGFGRTVNSWAATTDWDLPLGRWLALSGELYRGRALAGLGGSASGSVLFDGSPTVSTSAVLPLDTAGGWFQLKARPTSRIEFNGAFGEDRPSRTGVARLLAIGGVDGSAVGRNASGFLNAIVQARSSVLLSVEYRRLWTTGFDDVKRIAGQVSFSAGIGF